MIFGKFLLGIAVGVFIIPAMIADPAGTIETAQNIIQKIIEVFGYLSGVGAVLS